MTKLIKILNFTFTDRQMMGYFCYAMLVLATLSALTLGAFYPLIHLARLIANDTLPGLIYSAEVNNSLDNNFSRILLIGESHSTKEINELIAQIEAETRLNDGYIQKYQEAIFLKEDRDSFEAFMAERNKYLMVREQLFKVLQTQPERAGELVKAVILPAYQKYHEAGRSLIKYNARIGQERSEKIVDYSWLAILFNLTAPILVLLFAVILGIRIFRL